MEQPTTQESKTRTVGILNRSAVKSYALTVSHNRRAGKFTRVGEDFIDQVEAELESAIRKIMGSTPEGMPACGCERLITGKAADKADEKLNELTHAIVFRAVMRHPSLGCTLKT
jgi:putative NADPH-quinone reductase